jgi:hypothetical protein
MTCRGYFSHPEPKVAISSVIFAMRELTGNEQRERDVVISANF